MVRTAQPLPAVAPALVLTNHRRLPTPRLPAAGMEVAVAAPMEGAIAPRPQLPVTLAVQRIQFSPMMVAPV